MADASQYESHCRELAVAKAMPGKPANSEKENEWGRFHADFERNFIPLKFHLLKLAKH